MFLPKETYHYDTSFGSLCIFSFDQSLGPLGQRAVTETKQSSNAGKVSVCTSFEDCVAVYAMSNKLHFLFLHFDFAISVFVYVQCNKKCSP